MLYTFHNYGYNNHKSVSRGFSWTFAAFFLFSFSFGVCIWIGYSKLPKKHKFNICFCREALNWEPRKRILLGLISVNFFIYIILIALSAYSTADYIYNGGNRNTVYTVTESDIKTLLKDLDSKL